MLQACGLGSSHLRSVLGGVPVDLLGVVAIQHLVPQRILRWVEPGGLVFKAHKLCVSLNSRLESNEEEEKVESGMGCRDRASRSGAPLALG